MQKTKKREKQQNEPVFPVSCVHYSSFVSNWAEMMNFTSSQKQKIKKH